MTTMSDKNKLPKTRGRGRSSYAEAARADGCLAGAGGDNQTSTLNAEAPEFRPPTALMEHLRIDRSIPQNPQRASMQNPSQVTLTDLVSKAIGRLRHHEKVDHACDQLLSYMCAVTCKEDLIPIAKLILAFADRDTQNFESIAQLGIHLGEKFVSPRIILDSTEPLASQPFLHVFMDEIEARISHLNLGCLPNGYMPQCGLFLNFLAVLYPLLGQSAKTLRNDHLGNYILTLVNYLLESNNLEAYDCVIKTCQLCGPALEDDFTFLQKQHPQYAERLENLYNSMRLMLAERRLADVNTALQFINLLELRAANWGRLDRSNMGNNTTGAGYSRQYSTNSEGLMDDEMYECYEQFLAETGQI